MSPMVPLFATAASTITASLGNGLVLACILGCTALAWRQGFFFVTLVGAGVLAALVLALAGAGELARLLIESDMSPRHAPLLAYATIFAGVVVAAGMALSQWVPEQPVWNGTPLGRLVGLGVGALAGIVLAGGILIGWSMAVVPPGLHLQPQDLSFDAGSFALNVACSFVEPDRGRREALLGGWQRFTSDEPGLRPACSEPYVDADHNCMRDDHDRYLDINRDSRFTPLVPAPGDGRGAPERWRPGMLDCYVLGSWLDVTAAHAPRLTSPPEADIDVSVLGGGLYQAAAEDPDPCDRLKYSIKQTDPGHEPLVTIDPESGRVDLTEAAAQEVQPKYEFTVLATDLSGLVAELAVKVRVRNLPETKDP
ncbi:MAG: cadherin domain-containing protein [Planctomycetia bacterium]